MMRYVNRRRLLMVVVLAALFGAALPYVLLSLPPLPPKWADEPSDWSRKGTRGYTDRHGNSSIEHARVGWISEGTPSDEAQLQMRADLGGLAPNDIADIWKCHAGSVTVVRIGWPFRAAHGCTVSQDTVPGPILVTSTSWERPPTGRSWLDSRLPEFIPLGVIWTGIAGNVAVWVAIFAGVYCGLACWRAQRRISRGRCWKCAYLSHGAAVCPECGAGVKA